MILQVLIEDLVLVIGLLLITMFLFPRSSFRMTVRQRISVGLLQGLFGILFIHFGYPVTEHIVLDYRQLTLMTAAHFGGFTGALTAGLLIGGFRFWEAGGDPGAMQAALYTFLAAAGAGGIAHYIRTCLRRWVSMTVYFAAVTAGALLLILQPQEYGILPYYTSLLLGGSLFAALVYTVIQGTILRLNVNRTIAALMKEFERADHGDIHRKALQEIIDLLECDYGSLLTVDRGGYKMVTLRDNGVMSETACRVTDIDTESVEIVRRREPLLFPNWNRRRPSGGLDQHLYAQGMRSSLHLPVLYQGQVIAVINAGSRRADHFSRKHLLQLEQTAPIFSFGLSHINAENMYRAVSQTGQEAIILADGEMRILEWNPGAERIYGYTRREALGQPLSLIIPHLCLESFAAQEAAAGQAEPVPGGTLELEGLHRDGHTFPIEISFTRWQAGTLFFYSSIIRDITRRKKTEAQILDSENRFRALFENASDMILLGDFHNAVGLILEANDVACRKLGYTKNELRGMTGAELGVGDEHFNAEYAKIIRLLKEEGSATFEWRLKAKNGEVILCECSTKIIELGGRKASLNMLRDISDRKRAEEELRNSEARYRRLVELSPELIAVHTDGKVVFINQSGARMLGAASPEELIGRSIMDFVHPEYHEVVGSRTRQMYDNGTPVELLEEKLVGVDGRIIDVLMQGTDIRYKGKASAMVMALDLTERRRAELSLKETEDRFRKLIELSPDAVCVYQEGRIVFANARAAAIFGLSGPAEVVGSPTERFLHPKHYDKELLLAKELYHKNGILPHLELTYLTAQGAEVMVEVSISSILDGGKPAIFTSFRDISERKAAEQKLQETNRKLQEANRQLQQLSSRDGLTGIPNRRSFDEAYARAWEEAARGSKPLSVILCDIDFFKAYNDTYGHQGGDACLRAVAGIFEAAAAGSGQLAARYGGEEFVILLPGSGVEEARAAAEAVRAKVEQAGIPHKASKAGGCVTLSAGIATVIPHPLVQPGDLIGQADKALYRAKLQGRNRVAAYGDAAGTGRS
ncbi:PAS domain S-box protein [Paenibacillus mucilaginosus]|uniref:PAS domain S-box protein n=2 Tax=Paenibacillus mucilaginosus TaxID=61624 RepID=UPI00240E92FF|nr:PAS domain S-box protein [Paenibacillus mucilaginosus]WFA16169.1 PAS domain S-box protein [Paenibacillus mucilaginosus]